MNVKDGRLANLDKPFKGIQANVDAMAATGFNCLRVDFNNISLHDGGTPGFLAQLDQVVASARKAGLRVVIADHDNEGTRGTTPDASCTGQQANGLWYDLGGATDGTDGCKNPGHTTQESYRDDWVSIASRYAGNNTVIGYDLWNEPIASRGHSLWGGGGDRDIHRMVETVGSAMLSRDASKLIFAECPLAVYDPTTLYDGVTVSSAPWGDCTGVKNLPVVFTVNGQTITNKVVYDVHLYANSIDDYARIFGSSSSPKAIKAMNDSFGFLETQNIAPVWDGEGGTGFRTNPDDQDWANMLVKYLNGELGAQGGPTFAGNQQGMGIAWMSWNTPYTGEGDDNLGILNTDGTRIAAQLTIVNPLLYHPKRGVRSHARTAKDPSARPEQSAK
jgi:aryl-phospho-beta-D-glucosidase BglC (GH1 family)